jgi:uncharacterized membrane protein (DUF4010 family)
VFAAVLLVVRGAQVTLGERGLYAAAALSAVADVDAPTIAFARLGGGAAPSTSAVAITVAVVVNTLVKLGLAAGLGAGRFRLRVATGLGAMAAAGVLAGAVLLARG